MLTPDAFIQNRPELSLRTWEGMLRDERKSAASNLIDKLSNGDTVAAFTLYALAGQAIQAVIDAEDRKEDDVRSSQHGGFFTADRSVQLLLESERLEGFARAIASTESKKVSTIVDVGSGPAAVLAMLAARIHPHAEIETYEMSVIASKAARKVLELFGYDKQICVTTANALTDPIQSADLAITETFRQGQFLEPGLLLMDRFAELDITHIIPDRVDMLYSVVPFDPNGHTEGKVPLFVDWKLFQTIRAGDRVEKIQGAIPAHELGIEKILWIRSDYYTDDTPVLVGPDASQINQPTSLGRLPFPGMQFPKYFHFSYKPCVDLRDSEMRRWYE